MKKLSYLILIYLILSINAIDIDNLKENLVLSFSSDKEASDSLDYTGCLKLLETQEYLDIIKQALEEEGYPEDYDLKEIALAICQQIAPENEEIQTQKKPLLAPMRAGQLKSTSFYKPVSLSKEIRDLGTTILMPVEDRFLEREIVLQGFFKDLWNKIKEAAQKVIVAVFTEFLTGLLKGILGIRS